MYLVVKIIFAMILILILSLAVYGGLKLAIPICNPFSKNDLLYIVWVIGLISIVSSIAIGSKKDRL